MFGCGTNARKFEMMRFATEILRTPFCPPAEAIARKRIAFRFVQEDLDHPNNNLPPAVIIPGRFPPGHPKHCDSWGLSFFTTQEHAITFYSRISRTSARFAETVGTHVATVQLNEHHGLQTNPNADGHFNLFQSKDFELSKQSSEVALIQ